MYNPNSKRYTDLKMHSNKLLALPSKFESLVFLRTVNLSKNALSAEALENVSQIPTIVELYLAHNQIEGPLTSSIGCLKELQILDLEGNSITSVPEIFGMLRRMRILLLADNQIEALPWKALEGLNDLYDLDVSSNKLSGNLLPTDIDQITFSTLSNF